MVLYIQGVGGVNHTCLFNTISSVCTILAYLSWQNLYFCFCCTQYIDQQFLIFIGYVLCKTFKYKQSPGTVLKSGCNRSINLECIHIDSQPIEATYLQLSRLVIQYGQFTFVNPKRRPCTLWIDITSCNVQLGKTLRWLDDYITWSRTVVSSFSLFTFNIGPTLSLSIVWTMI